MPRKRIVPGRTGSRIAAALPAVLIAMQAGAALGETGERIVANPPELAIERTAPSGGTAPMALPSGVPAAGQEARLGLDIAYFKTRIYNPTTKSHDTVDLRTYNQSLDGPTIRIRPGETVRATLSNDLPDENCILPEGTHNIPNCFNRTNLHSHGLWVSPVGNGDNVLLDIQPGVDFQYEYNVPLDHPAGTFWYHPHRHGSTALQVASGMSGALVIAGDRPPRPNAPGDIDTILRYADGEAFKERILLFQQIQYACRDDQGNIKTRTDAKGNVVAWVCDPGDVGGIESYDQFGPGTWGQSGRYTSINGEIQPVMVDAQAGRTERWRMIHAGVRDTIRMHVVKMSTPAQPQGLEADGHPEWIAANCDGETVDQWQIAADGLTLARIDGAASTVLQPGYRIDALMVFPEAGSYCVVDDQIPASGAVGAADESRRLLAVVRVEGGQPVPNAGAHIKEQLVAATRFLPADVREGVAADLENDLGTPSFVWHRTIGEEELTGQQQLTFSIDVSTANARFGIDHQAYSPDRVDRLLTLGGVEEWTLTSTLAGHPFHIHVNPFQVVRILNPAGVDVTDPAVAYEERLKLEGGDPQYLDLKGVWKDTLFTKQGYQVVVRTRYQRYIGEFVLHCHILDHEDQGMMQNVKIVIPGTSITAGSKGNGHH
ncbi:multicopper oxidase family protein [Arenibaculum sp.]|uniref:multicopper oxidase family protein n=1 Tax=Arenibaculum sp. TaxID=2865862 RepID=UPI002E11F7DA|nr:multicopper oxidase domain-containing protein [Arenibaculum sp.]